MESRSGWSPGTHWGAAQKIGEAGSRHAPYGAAPGEPKPGMQDESPAAQADARQLSFGFMNVPVKDQHTVDEIALRIVRGVLNSGDPNWLNEHPRPFRIEDYRRGIAPQGVERRTVAPHDAKAASLSIRPKPSMAPEAFPHAGTEDREVFRQQVQNIVPLGPTREGSSSMMMKPVPANDDLQGMRRFAIAAVLIFLAWSNIENPQYLQQGMATVQKFVANVHDIKDKIARDGVKGWNSAPVQPAQAAK